MADPSAAGARPGRLSPRFVDKGAVFAGYVGIGMAVVIAIAFALIIPVQTLVFIASILGGVLIGAYANQRSNRWRPMKRVFGNAVWAALVTGLSLAMIWGILRLVFVQFDSGATPDGTYISCQLGPDCTWKRYLADGKGEELAAAGVTDGASFGRYFFSDVIVVGGGMILAFTMAGALVAAGFRSIQRPPADGPAQGTFIPRKRD
ncbi:MAG: hypothetical protein U0869_00980 [Chloroflexota bacterium]